MDRGDFLIEVGELFGLGGGAEAEGGRGEEDVAVHGGVGGAVEEGVELVEFLLGDGVEFVIVANGAAGGEAKPNGDGGVGAVDGVAEDEFFVDAAAFAGGDVAAVEAGGDFLIEGGVGEEVAGELPGGELVKGEVVIEGADDPVAVGPHAAFVVEVEAVGIGVAGGVEPVAAHVFAVALGFEEAGDEFFVGVGGGVGEEGVDFLEGGREAGEVEGDAADEGFFGSFGGGGEIVFGEFGLDEVVYWISDFGFWISDLGRLQFDWRFEAPVFLVFGAFVDPAFEGFDLRGGEFFVGFGWGHDFVLVGGEGAVDDGAGLGVAGFDGESAVDGGVGAFGSVEAEVGLAFFGVEAVAGEAVVGEDGADVAVEVEGACGVGGAGEQEEGEEEAGGHRGTGAMG